MIPVYLNCRDRVTCLQEMIDWLERAGCEDITLIDNASTWEPMVEYLRSSRHTVVRLEKNLGARALWHADLQPKSWYVYSDPDIIPLPECPLDLIERLADVMEKYLVPKAGPGLYLDDLPADHECLPHYAQLRMDPIEPGVYRSFIDTTFALYAPGQGFTFDAIRLGHPYMARHTSWYLHDAPLDAENAYYCAHAMEGSEGSSWATWDKRA